MFHFHVTNLELFASFNKFNIFLMFYYLYYSVKIDESKEKFKIVFCCISAITDIAAPSISSGLAWQAALKKTKVRLESLTDVDMLLMVE